MSRAPLNELYAYLVHVHGLSQHSDVRQHTDLPLLFLLVHQEGVARAPSSGQLRGHLVVTRVLFLVVQALEVIFALGTALTRVCRRRHARGKLTPHGVATPDPTLGSKSRRHDETELQA